ncbi:MAG: PaaX family transcriptional regulator [Gammaproteobacteria bacterium]|nr:PaaX family transcriptional regulator [Rhodoferax sp.]MBU3898258.1 PaaX family transcriptional regulator [Gammaproteobacteria bacterium]MBU3997008.1 PaaX family transcriptional regulator [Gammaproteobacteria bacterium]MBU4081443.1 PaaX family transcriptional regulator [Gammaproteobacteria bacterium]MBU4114222.1 PaaX family transcriptional regulator [Gammaproteobacteria bacterium]
MKVNPKNLILDLMLAAGDKPLIARDAILAGALFQISDNSLRVTLARLSAAGLIETAERGAYRLGPAATDLAGEVASWRTLESRLRAWQGSYIVVHCGALGRHDRAAPQRRERALQMMGFRLLERGLYIRPDNIESDLDEVRQHLYKRGLDRDAAVFRASGLDPTRESSVRQLWDGQALTQSYRQLRVELQEWLANAHRLPLEAAARESFLLGGKAIHQLVFDPLLPEPFVDSRERHAFIQAVHQFDDTGRAIWKRFFASIADTPPPFPATDQPAELETPHELSS